MVERVRKAMTGLLLEGLIKKSCFKSYLVKSLIYFPSESNETLGGKILLLVAAV